MIKTPNALLTTHNLFMCAILSHK